MTTEDTLANDLLYGADAIARYMFGDDARKYRRRVYYLVSQGYLPVTRLGDEIIGRKSEIERRLSAERAA